MYNYKIYSTPLDFIDFILDGVHYSKKVNT